MAGWLLPAACVQWGPVLTLAASPLNAAPRSPPTLAPLLQRLLLHRHRPQRHPRVRRRSQGGHPLPDCLLLRAPACRRGQRAASRLISLTASPRLPMRPPPAQLRLCGERAEGAGAVVLRGPGRQHAHAAQHGEQQLLLLQSVCLAPPPACTARLHSTPACLHPSSLGYQRDTAGPSMAARCGKLPPSRAKKPPTAGADP